LNLYYNYELNTSEKSRVKLTLRGDRERSRIDWEIIEGEYELDSKWVIFKAEKDGSGMLWFGEKVSSR